MNIRTLPLIPLFIFVISFTYVFADWVYDLPLSIDYSIMPEQTYYDVGDVLTISATITINSSHSQYEPDDEFHLTAQSILLSDEYSVISCSIDKAIMLNTSSSSYDFSLTITIVKPTSTLWLCLDAWLLGHDYSIERRIDTGEIENSEYNQWLMEHPYRQILAIENVNPPIHNRKKVQ